MSVSSPSPVVTDPSTSEPSLAVAEAQSAAHAQEMAGAQASSSLRVSWPHLVLSFIGMGVAAYAWYEHGVIKAGGETGCGISQTISCDDVIGSKYGEIFGLPLGVYGMLYFAVVLVTAISTAPGLADQRSAVMQRLVVTTLGVCCSAVLTYISVRVIGKICPICMGTHTTTFLLFCVSLWQMLKLRQTIRLEQ